MFNFDKPIFEFLYGLTGHFWVLDWFIAFFAKGLPYILIATFVIILLKLKSFRRQVYFGSLVTISSIISWGMITAIFRYLNYSPRPFEALGIKPLIVGPYISSMPSGHMTILLPFALTAFYINKNLGIKMFLLTLLVGVCRVMVGVHWLSDIVAGIAISFLGFYLAKALLPKLEKKN